MKQWGVSYTDFISTLEAITVTDFDTKSIVILIASTGVHFGKHRIVLFNSQFTPMFDCS